MPKAKKSAGRARASGVPLPNARVSRGRVHPAGVSFPVAPPPSTTPSGYAKAFGEIKRRVQQERLRVVLAANTAMVRLYWDIGRVILDRQESEGWGAKVIDRLATDLRAAFPDMKGFSPRNLKYMRAFAAAWPERAIVQEPLARIPWFHHIALMEKCSTPEVRLWYARRSAEQGWSHNILALQIDARAHARHGKALTNFKSTLPPADSDMAAQVFKDPYLFDFLGTADRVRSRTTGRRSVLDPPPRVRGSSPRRRPHMIERPSQFVAVAFLALIAASTQDAPSAPREGLKDLDGEWVWVEDRTEGRTLEQISPPMSSSFSFRVEKDAVILARGHGSGHKDVRVALDGSVTEIKGEKDTARYSGKWKDGAFEYDTEFVNAGEEEPRSHYRKEFRVTAEGMIVRVAIDPAQGYRSVGLYKHPQDIPMPAGAKATIADAAWLAGAWVGTRGAAGTTSIEERWSPPLGGAMLAVSRTVARGKMTAFEYLRIVEKDGGLVYVAQPGGGLPTEFVLTELTATRAVFDNPRHDYPKRIAYEITPEGGLTATIGYLKGGTPRRFDFKREGK
jgi:predicted nuclease of restriction endonuclease-like (RecB) superfamily